MNITINNEIILIKNNFLFIKEKYFCMIKIPLDLKILFNNKNIFIFSNSFNIKNEISFYKLINNLILGVKKLWIKEINISGIGYKIFIKNKKIFFDLGFNDIKELEIAKYIFIIIKKEKIILKSVYKDKIGIFINKILKLKKYDPYKKKGLYFNNPIIKKSSKKKQ